MNAVSPKVEQQGDGEALLSSAISHEGDGDGAEAALGHRESEDTAVVAEGVDTGGEKGQQHQAKRSRLPWRRTKKEEQHGNQQESSEQAEGRGEANTRKKEGLFTYDWDNGERIVWKASKRSRAEVEEGSRKLTDYLALPPTEYSLLDPKMITRLSDETFRMDGATINIVGTKVHPVLFVKVEVQPENNLANIMVEKVELEGSEAVRSAGGSFNVTSSTVVSCTEIEGAGEVKLMELRTAADIEIELLIPNENFIPPGVLRRAGNFVMQRSVDIGLPQFTKFLKRDYSRWAEGDDSRGAVVSEGETLIEQQDE
eukprot:g11079.t2